MSQRELSARAWVALIAVYIAWGSTYLAIKYVVETMPPLLTASVRFLVAGAVMYAIGIRSGDRSDRPTAAHWRASAIIGTALLLGGNGLVNLAEQRPLGSGTTALLIATVPLWLALFDRIWFGARLSRPVVAGLVLGFGGAALLVRPPTSAHAIDLTGALLAIAASAIWAAGSLYARAAPLPKRPSVSTGMEMICGGVALGLAGIARGELAQIHFARFSASSLFGLAYLIVGGSWIGFTAYVWLIRNVRTTIAGTYAFVNPLVAVLLGYVFRDEKLTVITAIAGAIIVAAVALIVATGRPPVKKAEPEEVAVEPLPT
jgi:drug/metabolite transporter (DMT)-like permease